MKRIKKLLCVLLCIAILFALSACNSSTREVTQDTSPITMFVPLGNGEAYYRALADNIKSDLGIDVEFVYQINCNTTEYLRSLFKNNDLPADIIFTASKTNNDILEDCCIDLLGRSSVTSLFTQTALHECTTEDGAVYQLPITTKLIGVTYNETLLNEMGWEVPNNFDDMVELKSKCDEAGITFAICDGAATGHGFNWLFHLMGSEWLSTLEGTSWLEAFQAGTASIDEFKENVSTLKIGLMPDFGERFIIRTGQEMQNFLKLGRFSGMVLQTQFLAMMECSMTLRGMKPAMFYTTHIKQCHGSQVMVLTTASLITIVAGYI